MECETCPNAVLHNGSPHRNAGADDGRIVPARMMVQVIAVFVWFSILQPVNLELDPVVCPGGQDLVGKVDCHSVPDVDHEWTLKHNTLICIEVLRMTFC